MSLVRPRWLDDLIKPAVSASPRLRGLKAFDPQHVPAFQDPLYADDPQFWTCTGFIAAAALNLGKLGIQTPADDSMVVCVDGALVEGAAADDILFDVILGGTLLLALATDPNVTKRNRREQSRNTGVERVGLLRIADNANAFTGTSVAACRVTAGATILVPLGFRLFGSEQFFARSSTVNTAMEATLFGRLTTKGQR